MITVPNFLAALPRHEGGLSIKHNPHKGYYQTVQQYLDDDIPSAPDDDEWVSPEQKAKAIATNELWACQWYPDTPVGFYRAYAADLTALLKHLQPTS